MFGTSPASGIRYSSNEPVSAWPSASWRICSISVTPIPIAIPPRIWPSQRARVDDRPDVVDGQELQERDLPGVDVDLDDDDVHGVAHHRIEGAEVGAVVVGQRRVRVVVGERALQAALHALAAGRPCTSRPSCRCRPATSRALSSATPRTRTTPSTSSMSSGLASSEWAAISNIFSRTFVRRAADRAREHHGQPRAARAGARQPVGGRVVGDRDVLGLDPQLLGHDLRRRRSRASCPRTARTSSRSRRRSARPRSARSPASWTCRRTGPGCGTRTRSRRRSSAAAPARGRCRCSGPARARAPARRARSRARRARAPCRAPPGSRRSRRRCRSGSCTGTGRAGSGCAAAARCRRSRARPPRASTSRSSTQLCTSEPAPRNTPCWFLLVSTALTAVSHEPIVYGPVVCAIAFVLPATANRKYAP